MAYLTKASIESVRDFNRFYTRRIGALQGGYLGSPFPLPQARLLFEIGRRGEASASELGAELDLDAGYLSRLLADLRRRRLVQGERARHDARRTRLTLTARERKAFAALDQGSRDAVEEMLRPLAAAEKASLTSALATAQRLLEGSPREITLRAHRPGDMGWVIQAHGAIYDREYGWGLQFEALVAGIAAKFLREFDPQRERCWIAERAGEPVGSVFVVKQSAATAKLRLLIVDPSARGLGLGKRLVRECIGFARAAGYRRLVLWTQSNLAAARSIYASQGFRKARSERHRGFGVPLTGEYWSLRL